MTTLLLAFLVVGTIGLRELTVGAIVWLRRRRLRHATRADLTRSQFAAARTHLMRLALQGSMDVESATFQTLYQIDTLVMRRPDQYTELSGDLRKRLLSFERKRGDSAVLAESQSWNDETKAAVGETARALQSILLDYSAALRTVVSLERYLGAVTAAVYVMETLERLAAWVKQRAIRRDQRFREVAEGQESMLQLST